MATSNLIVDVDRYTGEFISGWPRCAQSIETILTTRLRTRIMRLWWGSEYLSIMDKPMIQDTFVRGIAAAMHYIDLYEPEFQVKSVTMIPSYTGKCIAQVAGIYLPDQTSKTAQVTLF